MYRFQFAVSLVILVAISFFDPAHADDDTWARRICDKAGKSPDSRSAYSWNRPLAAGDPYFDQLAALLPTAPDGWTAGPTTGSAFVSDTIGCGLIAGRKYRGDGAEVQFGLQVSGIAFAARTIPEVGAALKQCRFNARYKCFPESEINEMLVGNMLVFWSGGSEEEQKLILTRIDFPAVERASKIMMPFDEAR